MRPVPSIRSDIDEATARRQHSTDISEIADKIARPRSARETLVDTYRALDWARFWSARAGTHKERHAFATIAAQLAAVIPNIIEATEWEG